MSSNRPDQKPVDAPPSETPVQPQTPDPQGPPVKPQDDPNPGHVDPPGKGG
ncbi:MAG TPA: hypothetical protein VL866_24535 [Pyrinomonadaceae bacterium]|nr:hypothetical protein [Pyrinomonadaceae bacterium]